MTIKIKDDRLYFPVSFEKEDIISVLEYPQHFCIEFALCSNWNSYEDSEGIDKDTMTATEIQEFRHWCDWHNIEIKQKRSK